MTTHPTRADEPRYAVTLTLRVTTTVAFARGAGLDDATPILPSDAIANGVGSIPQAVWDELEGEGFDVADPIDGEAVLL